ncbi:arsenic resistance protein [Haliea sp. E1-2-M8]|uniref:arsenic resistance protein n=1 Tax=Haliea sp. E1-2-M8 TaxID=3064706 RepID=UPI002721B43F|nr:arsenic resistance protein [Haliea sp. E1-2-M8]MDO8861635.1 arsenic resistance protein [Haliea sp. E1-2-M8]
MTLERRQVWIYLAAIVGGLLLGTLAPEVGPNFEVLLWPVLATLLYTTFVQVPLLHVRDAFRDRRFLLAVVLGNFLLLPVVVWLMLQWLPAEPALRLGVLLVLLVPCTDWFITFSQLGRGNTARAIAVTPLNLLLQLLLLPVYLWLMLPVTDFSEALRPESMLPAALTLIGLPLLAAALTERWVETQPERAVWRERLGWWPVPLLALVVFLIAGAQVGTVLKAGPILLRVLPVFVSFLLVAALLARGLTHWLQLPMDVGRTLAFSFGTRNSFVVLPFALALPVGWEATVVVVVFQSLVELFGMAFYLWWLPRRLFR